MLGYVFWHAPRGGVDPFAYVEALVAFHAALAHDPPPGFIRSMSTRTSRLPWLDGEISYEDWYIIANSAALDALDAAAVDTRRRNAHTVAANAALSGAGGLYRLLRGEPIVPLQTEWIAKPDGASYADFMPTLDAAVQGGATVWQRQMVLGPAPEFAVQTLGSVGSAKAVRIAQVNVLSHDLPSG